MALNWDDLERWLEGQQLPQGFEALKEPEWVERFVRRMMTKSLPDIAGRITGKGSAAVTESKQFITVKFKLPSGCEQTAIRLYVKEDLLRIEGLPGGRHEIVRLRKLVKPGVCRAVVKNRMLYIKLRKRTGYRKLYEHPIHWQ